MGWIDNLINKTIGLPYAENGVTRMNVTFKGSGKMSPERGYWWKKGFQDGYDFAVKYTINGICTKEWPKGWEGALYNGHYGDGYAEGQLSGRCFCLDRDFPNWKNISWHGDKLKVEFHNGRILYVNE